jgi:predicted phage terminase large subunit-like protein
MAIMMDRGDAAEQIRQAIARKNLTEFNVRVDPDYDPTLPHSKIVNEYLDALAAREIENLMVFMPPQHGKPCYNGTMILMADGSYKALGDVVVGDRVITHTGFPQTVTAVFEHPGRRAVRLTAQSGRSTVAALDHPFLTPAGWVNAGDLQVGMSLGNVAVAKTDGAERRSAYEYRLAGYYIGDGHCAVTGNAAASSITNIDALTVADVEACAEALGFTHDRRGVTTFINGGARQWLRDVGLAGTTSHTKRVPDWVFRSDNASIAEFLGAYFACDGSIVKRAAATSRAKVRTDVAIELYSVSKELLGDAQRLFLRLGIQTRLRRKDSVYKGAPYVSYRLAITDRDGAARFAALVSLHSVKAERVAHYVRDRFDQPILADAIVAIERVESADCRCLTVEVDHTFTADDFVVHNSTYVSQRFPAYVLGKSGGTELVATTSYSIDIARKNSRACRNLLRDTERWPFPNVMLDPTAQSVDEWYTTTKGGVKAAGVGGSLTGFGATKIFVDDAMKNMEEADSLTVSDKTWEWYQTTVSTRQRYGVQKCVVATRWRDNDLPGRILNTGAGKTWTVLTLRSVAEEDDILHRPLGEVLWVGGPKPLDPAQGEISSRAYSALYQQRPLPVEGALFKERWFSRRWNELPAMKRVAIFIDGAWKTGTQNDYSAIAVWGTDDIDYYLIHAWHGRVEYPELRLKVTDTFARFEHSLGVRPVVCVEDAASGTALVQELSRSTHIPIVGVLARGDKYARAEAQTPPFEAMKVVLPAAAEFLDGWIEEHLRFPVHDHDDYVDTTSGGLARLTSYVPRTFAKLSTNAVARPDPNVRRSAISFGRA